MGFTYSSVVCAEPDEVFAWHSRPGAITRMMPPWQPVRVAREAASVRDGVAVLALPAGLRWVARHDPDAYDPPRQFADVLQPPLGSALRARPPGRRAGRPVAEPLRGPLAPNIDTRDDSDKLGQIAHYRQAISHISGLPGKSPSGFRGNCP